LRYWGWRVDSNQQPDAEFAECSQSSRSLSVNELSEAVIGCAIEVQRHLGVGLLESAYAAAMAMEFADRKIGYEREVPVLAKYKGESVGLAYRADFIVDGAVVVELKAIDVIADVHRAQVLSYLRLGGFKLGLLINFCAAPISTRGVVRVVTKL